MVPLYKPYVPASLPEMDRILHSGDLSFGQWGRKFERMLAEYLGTPYVLTVNNYASNYLVLFQAMGLQPGDEVIASPMACLQSSMPYASAGLKLVWADVDPDTGTLSPDSVESCITPRTKLIAHNHFCGYPGYVDEVNAVGKKHGIPVLDDCIEAFGAQYKGAPMGRVGTPFTVFSFQTVRLPNTIDGGAIVFEDKSLYEKALRLRDLGIDRRIFRDADGEISPLCDISEIGYAATISNVNAYLGCLQLEEMDRLLGLQRDHAERWDREVSAFCSGVSPLTPRPGSVPNYWVYGLLAEDKHRAMMTFRENGFYASGVHLPNTYYSIFGHRDMPPGVAGFHSRFLALPCGWWM